MEYGKKIYDTTYLQFMRWDDKISFSGGNGIVAHKFHKIFTCFNRIDAIVYDFPCS